MMVTPWLTGAGAVSKDEKAPSAQDDIGMPVWEGILCYEESRTILYVT